ncbi:MAG: endonuclease/exonuclease/phosphatase family protein [Clostridia bacterium]
MKLRVMTYNIASGHNYEEDRRQDLAFAQGVIEQYQPDIVGLNEVQENSRVSQYTSQTQILAKGLEMYGYFGPALPMNDGLYGNAMLSKFAASTEVIPIPDPEVKNEDTYYETRCLMKNEIQLEQKITVLVTHFGLARQERKCRGDGDEDLRGSKDLWSLMGDFNALPHDDVIAPLFTVLKDTALITEDPLLSWPSDRPDRKIDHILVSPQIQVHHVFVPVTRASDHRPYIADIEL